MATLALAAALTAFASPAPGQRITDRYDPAFRKYSKRYFGVGFDWRLFKAQGMAESDLKPTARSWVGARGIMQLMPSTFEAISTRRPEMTSIDDPEWNIAAGILHDKYLWGLWTPSVPDDERYRFMFASYNAGEMPILRARGVARASGLADTTWESIASVAPKVRRWRYRETLGYVEQIDSNHVALLARERNRRVVKKP
jgi:membrane-bound lytic murein transglycosylase MltF